MPLKSIVLPVTVYEFELVVNVFKMPMVPELAKTLAPEEDEVKLL